MRTPLVVLLAALLVSGCRCRTTVGDSNGELALDWLDQGQHKTDRDARYDLGRVNVGRPAHVSVPVRNLGLGTLELVSLERLSGDPAFSLELPEPENLGAGETLTLDAAFAPTRASAEPLTATYRLTASNTEPGAETATITLVAVAVESPCAIPTGLDFGVVVVGDTAYLPLELENLTDAARVASFSAPTGVGASSFSVDARELGVPAHGKAHVTVQFKPSEVASYTAAVEVRASPECPAWSVTLSGSGVDEVLTWAPSPLDLGYVPVNASVTRTLTFSNLGNTSVTLTNLRSGSTTFSAGAMGLSVPARGTAELAVTFAPRALGPHHGQLSFDTSVAKQPRGTATLDGYGGGPEIDVRPTSLAFGKIAFFSGSTTPTQTRRISISNLGTTSPTHAGNLHLTGARVEIAPADPGTSAAELSVALDPALPYDSTTGIPAVAGKNRVEAVVSLTPSGIGHKEAIVSIHSNDFDEATVTVRVTADVVALPPCNYQLAPAVLAFGVVSPPALREQAFNLTNLGSNAGEICLLSGLTLRTGSDPTFSLPAGDLDQLELQPGEVKTVKVRAWPQGSRTTLTPVSGDVDFYISSPTTPRGHVALSANVGPSCVVLAPDEVQFGAVKTGCASASRGFSLYNACSSTVRLQSVGIASGGPQMFVTGAPAIPSGGLAIAPGGAPVTFQAGFRPSGIGPAEGMLAVTVTVGATNEVHLARLSGRGDTVGRNTDTFTQGVDAKADILLAIDGSCSMGNKQTALANNTAAFFAYAQNQDIDYHVAVLKAQGPMSNGNVGELTSGPGHFDTVLTPTTQNVASQFIEKVKGIGANGADEQCFEPVLRALTSPLVTSVNAGFLRYDATLAIICITDDVDFSPGTVSYYHSALANVKGASRSSWLTVNAIAGFNDDTCLGGNPDNGRYSQMVTLTGGVKEEICTPNWATTLQSVARAAFGTRGTFFLNAVPDTVSSPIVVKVDGVSVPPTGAGGTAWVYEPPANAIVFSRLYEPAPGSVIEVTYDVACL